MHSSLLIVICLTSVCFSKETPNTCSTWDDYYHIETSKNCWYEPEVYMGTEEYAKKYGYSIENYTLTTEDGYILMMFRLPRSIKTRGVIFLQHPATSSSDIWLDKGRKSLAFMLYDLGYDIWLPNLRGNKYGRHHLTLDPETVQFWNHSFHEMAKYDVKVQLDMVQNVTRVGPEITMLGHSLGGTLGILYPILHPKSAAKQLKEVIAACPSAQFKNNHNRVVHMLADNVDFISTFLTGLNQLELPSPLLKPFLNYFCINYKAGVEFCANTANWFMGGTVKGLIPELYPKVFAHQPVGISMYIFIHYLQCVRDGEFRHFDYGPEKNLLIYKSTKPPLYAVENISVPIHFVSGDKDALCFVEDIQAIAQRVPKPLQRGHVVFKGLNHMDFMYGKDFYAFNKYIVRHINKLYPRYKCKKFCDKNDTECRGGIPKDLYYKNGRQTLLCDACKGNTLRPLLL